MDLTRIHNTTSDPNKKLILINSIIADIYEAESNVRTYTLTHNELYLNYYLSTLIEINEKVENLMQMSQESPEQLVKIESIQSLLTEKGRILNELIDLKSTEQHSQLYENALREIDRLSMDTTLIPSVIARSVITTTQREDSIINRTEAETPVGLFSRVKGWFTQKEIMDTTITRLLVEVETKTDTLETMASPSDSLINDVLRVLYQIQEQQKQTRHVISTKEMEILRSDRLIMDQIRTIVSLLEQEELKNSYHQAEAIRNVVKRSTDSILTMGVVAIVLIILFTVLIFRDISRSSYYQARLLEAKTLAEKLLRIKEEFLSNMSHEIRTPLSAIIGFAQQLKKDNPKEKQELFINSLNSSGEHLMQIVNDILDLSKIDGGHIRFESIPFSPFNVMQEVINIFRVKAKEKNLGFELEAEEELSTMVLGDPFRLKQILFNLVSNAIKFTDKGSVTIRAKCLELTDTTVKHSFEVEDTGIGIGEEHIENLFERFTQADSSTTRSYGGTGLGLTIVKNLVELQGGTVNVKSTLEQGSTFFFNMPFALAKSEERTTELKVKSQDIKFPANTSILVIDDDPMSQILIGELLKNLNAKATILSSPREALELAQSKRFHFILTDIQMPKMSGFDVLKQLKTNAKQVKGKPKVFAFTANSMDDDPKRYTRVGFDGLLIKPFDEYKLYNLIAPFLNKEVIVAPDNGKINSVGTKPFDLTDIQRFSNDELESTRQIINSFISNNEINLNSLMEAYSSNNWASIGEITHRMKSSFRQFRANHVLSLIHI